MPPAYRRCVSKVARQKGVRSAHAICTAANAGNVKAVRRREATGRRRRKS